MKRSLMKDGKMLRECIEQYNYYRSGNNQMVVYTCLRDSRVFVPCRAGRVDESAFIRQDGRRCLPVFSNEAQLGDQTGSLNVEEKDFLDVIRAAAKDAADACICFVQEGADKAMTKYNQKHS